MRFLLTADAGDCVGLAFATVEALSAADAAARGERDYAGAIAPGTCDAWPESWPNEADTCEGCTCDLAPHAARFVVAWGGASGNVALCVRCAMRASLADAEPGTCATCGEPWPCTVARQRGAYRPLNVARHGRATVRPLAWSAADSPFTALKSGPCAVCDGRGSVAGARCVRCGGFGRGVLA